MNKLISFISILLFTVSNSHALSIDFVKQQSDTKIKKIVEPILEQYCGSQCKALQIKTEIDTDQPDTINPGFDDKDPSDSENLVAGSATVQLLFDTRLGPKTQQKVISLIKNSLDISLDYPVEVKSQSTEFPSASSVAGKGVELREKLTRQFKSTVEEVFSKFCGENCLLSELDVSTEPVSLEETQYGAPNEFIHDGELALKIKSIRGTLLMNDALSELDRSNIFEMVKLKTSGFKNVDLTTKSMKFPSLIKADAQDNRAIKSETHITERTIEKSSNNNSSQNTHQQQDSNRSTASETSTTPSWPLIAGLLTLLMGGMIAAWFFRKKQTPPPIAHTAPVPSTGVNHEQAPDATLVQSEDIAQKNMKQKLELYKLHQELTQLMADQPKTSKQLFTSLIQEESVELNAQVLEIFGDAYYLELMKDPALHSSVEGLMNYYAKNPIEVAEESKLKILKQIQQKLVAAKAKVIGKRSSESFDFLTELDGHQIYNLIQSESDLVQSITLTHCPALKRAQVFGVLNHQAKANLMNELSRIDYLPKDYIEQVAAQLKKKLQQDQRYNTQPVAGIDVLVSFLENSPMALQSDVIQQMSNTNPEGLKQIASKVVIPYSLAYTNQDVVMSILTPLKLEEVATFIKNAPLTVAESLLNLCSHDFAQDIRDAHSGQDAHETVIQKIKTTMTTKANAGEFILSQINQAYFNAITQQQKHNLKVIENENTPTEERKVA